MAFDRAAAEAVLKIDYLPVIREQINMATPFMAECERNTEDVTGLKARVPLHLGRSEAVGNMGELDTVPTAQQQRYKAAEFFTRINIGTIELTQAVIESTKKDDTSYLRALDSEQKGITNEAKENFGRQLICNADDSQGSPANEDISVGGASGTLATCGTTSGSTTVQLAATTDATTWLRLRKNMVVDIVAASNGVAVSNGTAVTVTAVDKTNLTITISGSGVTTTSAHIVVRTNSWGKEMRGINTVTQKGNSLMGVDGATWDEWNAIVEDNGGTARPFSEDLVQRLLDDIDSASGEAPDGLLCNYVQERAIYAELQSLKRSVNTLDLKGGFTSLAFNDRIPVFVDRLFRTDAIIAFNRKHMAIYETSDWSWNDEDGNVLKWVPNYLKYQAQLYKFADFGVDRRNAFGILKDLSTS